MAHMHNFAGTRELFWRRIETWAEWVRAVRDAGSAGAACARAALTAGAELIRGGGHRTVAGTFVVKDDPYRHAVGARLRFGVGPERANLASSQEHHVGRDGLQAVSARGRGRQVEGRCLEDDELGSRCNAASGEATSADNTGSAQ